MSTELAPPLEAPPAPPPEAAAVSTAKLRRVALASCAGTTIEFYDFFIYGTAAALVFPTVFFPALGTAAGTVASFATFAVAFGARPLGAVLFGHYGDRLGRKKTLISTLLLMGVATFLIGCLPSAASIGVAAPIALVVLRIAQGLAVGGEWAGATLLAAEYAPPGRRGLFATFPQLGPALAFALSSGTFLIVNQAVGETSGAFLDWGWRVPFLGSALLVLIGLYVRLAVEETPVFKDVVDQRPVQSTKRKAPIVETFRRQWREVFIAAGSLAMLFAFFYIGTAFLTSYGATAMGLSRGTLLTIGLLSSSVFGASIVLSGIYSDRVGRVKVVRGACYAALPWGLVLFTILDSHSTVAFAIGLIGTLAIFGTAYGPAGALLPELFDAEYRYTGAGIAYNLAGVLGGATAPLLAADLVPKYGGDAVGLMLAVFAAISLVCTLLLPETSRRSVAVVSTAPAVAADHDREE
ncbi:MFS transporter [Nocardioides daejeonensis]|uniref:MFS transporter n=1 Tax=Nocardioides daejeonensis TaxID=1046556 RepID=UPI0019515694|nr:MFS transporter [Nocardioides daejeonensis]